MAKPKAQTLQMKFGFMDEDHKTATHDEIAKWLYSVVESRLAEWVGYKENWTLDDIELESKQYISGAMGYDIATTREDVLKMNLPKKPIMTLNVKKWEHTVKNKNGFIIGFVDFYAKYENPKLYYSRKERTVILNDFGDGVSVYFEIKTKLPTLGELIRQMRMYQASASSGWWFVVAPSASSEDIRILREQGIGFIKYDPAA